MRRPRSSRSITTAARRAGVGSSRPLGRCCARGSSGCQPTRWRSWRRPRMVGGSSPSSRSCSRPNSKHTCRAGRDLLHGETSAVPRPMKPMRSNYEICCTQGGCPSHGTRRPQGGGRSFLGQVVLEATGPLVSRRPRLWMRGPCVEGWSLGHTLRARECWVCLHPDGGKTAEERRRYYRPPSGAPMLWSYTPVSARA